MKVLHECRATKVLFGTCNLMVTFICRVDQSKRSGWGQTRSGFKIHFFLQNYAYITQFYLGIPKIHLFWCTTIRRIPEAAFQKVTQLLCLCVRSFAFAQTEINIGDSLKLCSLVACVQLHNRHFDFVDKFIILDFKGFFWK